MGDWYFGTLLLYLILSYTHGYSYHDHSRLNHDLLQNYDPRVRGSLNSSETSHIGVEFYLTSILDYEEISGKFTFVGYFVFTWFDDRLKWNISDYNGIDMTRLYQSEVWHPSIAPTSSAREMRSFGNEWMLISFLSSGQGFWGPGDIFSSVCHADVTKYPFDIQECNSEYMFSGLDSSNVNVTALYDHILLTLYRQHSRWNLLNTKTYVELFGQYSIKIKLVLIIQRESAFYVVGLILPITLLTMLNLLVFLLPVESGERISYSITVLLAMTVFLTIASDNLPPTSKPGLPLLCIKLFIDMSISGLIVTFTILGLRLYHIDPVMHPIPSLLRKIFNFQKKECSLGNEMGRKKECSPGNEIERIDKKETLKYQDGNDNLDSLMNNTDNLTWQTVSKKCDILFFWFSLFLYLISNGVILYIMCV